MPRAAALQFEPRKTPQQARSAASVSAILEATVQVLLQEGKLKLTTTRVAQRAGVSVGTLYQYFPNKASLLQALLKEHLDQVAVAIENACVLAEGKSLAEMAEAIISAFVQAKFKHLDASVGLYAISDDMEGKRIAHAMHARAIRAMTALLKTARGVKIANAEVVASTLLSAMAGVSRVTLGRGVTRATMNTMGQELLVMVSAYLEASATRCQDSGS